jgi:hypothetical protein
MHAVELEAEGADEALGLVGVERGVDGGRRAERDDAEEQAAPEPGRIAHGLAQARAAEQEERQYHGERRRVGLREQRDGKQQPAQRGAARSAAREGERGREQEAELKRFDQRQAGLEHEVGRHAEQCGADEREIAARRHAQDAPVEQQHGEWPGDAADRARRRDGGAEDRERADTEGVKDGREKRCLRPSMNQSPKAAGSCSNCPQPSSATTSESAARSGAAPPKGEEQAERQTGTICQSHEAASRGVALRTPGERIGDRHRRSR